MSKPEQNVPKVLGVVCYRPPDRIGIPLPLGILLWCVLYPIRCSLGILLSALQGRKRWQGLGWGGHRDWALGTGCLRKWTRTEGGIWVDERQKGYKYLFYFMSFGCAIPDSTIEGRKLKDIYNVLLKVYIKEEEWDMRGRVIYWTLRRERRG